MLHFDDTEFAARRAKLDVAMAREKLDGMLLFAPESHFWLTGFDTFGFAFFQCLIYVKGRFTLVTRAPDLRQAQLTSNIDDIRIWADGLNANPANDLADALRDLGAQNLRFGIETRTAGLKSFWGEKVRAACEDIMELSEASHLISKMRLVQSPAELIYTKQAAKLSDDALAAGLAVTKAGANETQVLNAMQGAVFEGGGDYAGNEFIVGGGDHALLCRYQSGRRVLDQNDQMTLEWAGAYRHYHAAFMRTVVIGEPKDAHYRLQEATEAALKASEGALAPGNPMGAVYEAHAAEFDARGLSHARLNACGYSMGIAFAPIWMDEQQMFYQGSDTVMEEGMVFFLHMILMDDKTGAANCLGRSSVITKTGSEPLSDWPLDLIIR